MLLVDNPQVEEPKLLVFSLPIKLMAITSPELAMPLFNKTAILGLGSVNSYEFLNCVTIVPFITEEPFMKPQDD